MSNINNITDACSRTVDRQRGQSGVSRLSSNSNRQAVNTNSSVSGSNGNRNSVGTNNQVAVTSNHNSRSTVASNSNHRNRASQRSNRQRSTVRNIRTINLQHCKVGVVAQISNTNNKRIRSRVTSLSSNSHRDSVVTSAQTSVTRNNHSGELVAGGCNYCNRARCVCNVDHVVGIGDCAVHTQQRQACICRTWGHVQGEVVDTDAAIGRGNGYRGSVVALD